MGTDDTTAAEAAAEEAASRLTPEEKRGPSTLQVALLLLAGLLVLSVLSAPEMVLPRDSTLLGERHVDEASGLEVPVPVGWRVDAEPDFGTTQIVPEEAGTDPPTRIIAGRLDGSTAASAIADDSAAATALAETVQLYVLGVSGTRDEVREVEVENDVGTGAAVSYVVVPENGQGGGLVYTAVFGSGNDRSWLAYLSRAQGSAPAPRWVDRIVRGVRPTE